MTMLKRIGAWLLAVGACVPLACAPPDASETSQPDSLSTDAFRVVATDLESPWEVAWGPDSHLWITERVGKRIIRVNPEDGSRKVAVTISDAYQDGGQDGVLGMALHPGLLANAGNDYVYVGFIYDADPGPEIRVRGMIRRYTYDAGTETLISPLDLITGIPAGNDHIAGRLVFGSDGALYYSVGDQGSNWLGNYCNQNRAQQLPTAEEISSGNWNAYQGKILRLNPDGSIPEDNPVLKGVRSHVYSYGHRNPQGLAFGPDGTLYSAEHGPSTDDEINRIEAGKNYGWPHVAGYQDDQAYIYANWAASDPVPCSELAFSTQLIPESVPTAEESSWSHPDFTPPIRTFFTVPDDHDFRASPGTVAASDLEVYALTDGIPGWANSLLLTSLTQGVVYRMKLTRDGLGVEGEVEEKFRSTNRYRDIAVGASGRSFYIITDNTGRTRDAAGGSTQVLENPGAVLEFTDAPD